MPSYTSYINKLHAMDANDDNIETWITVNGNHIPIMKGQSKEEAVKNFIAKKSDKATSERTGKPESVGSAAKRVVKQTGENRKIYKEATGKKLSEEEKKHQEIEEGWQKTLRSLEPQTVEQARLWLADTLASTEGFTSANFSKEDKALLKKMDEKFGDGWWKTDEEFEKIKAGREQTGWIESPKFEKLTEQYMPDQGESDNELGEALRSINRVVYRYYNDGDMWNRGYGKETVNWAVKHLTALAKNKNTPRHIARGIENGLYELKRAGINNKDKYETALRILVQTFEFANQSELDDLSKMKRNS